MNNNVPDNLPTEENIPILENPAAPTMISPEDIPEAPASVLKTEEAFESGTANNLTMNEKYKQAMEYGQKGIIGILILIVLVIGIFGIIKIVPYIVSSTGISSLFTQKENLGVAISTDPIIPGKQFAFSVTHRGITQSGTHTWGYDCGGATLKERTLTSDNSIPCGSEKEIEPNTDITLLVPLTETKKEIRFFTMFVGLDGRKTTAEKNIAVGTTQNAPTTVTPVKTAPAQNTTQKTLTGSVLPDLSVTLIQSGISVPGTNTIIPTTILEPQNRAGVKFFITNNGRTTTGAWQFRAIVPNQTPGQVYFSPLQAPLAPGDSIEFTLGFDGSNGNPVSNILIQADANALVAESNEGNNDLLVSFFRSAGQYPKSQYTVPSHYYNNYDYRDRDDYYGKPDLRVDIIDVGYLDSDNDFVRDSSISRNDDAAIRVRVSNTGTDESGRYDIGIMISANNRNYAQATESNQSSLEPGESDDIIIELPRLTDDETSDITVTVDPDDEIDERSDSNNEAESDIRVN